MFKAHSIRKNHRPYLSLVGWTRNDGYTSNYVEKTQHAISAVLRQLNQHELDTELLIVEWNPPSDRPQIGDLLHSLDKQKHVTVRIVTVPAKYHRRYRGWRERGIPTVEALNVGLRRARGHFVTPKPLDVFYSDALISRLARRDLDEHAVYRCDRHDVQLGSDTWWDSLGDAFFTRLATSPTRINTRLAQSPLWRIRDLHTNACGDFTLLSNGYWSKIRGYPKDRTVLGLDADSIALHAAAAHGAQEICFDAQCCVYKIVHGNLHAQRTTAVWKPWQERLERYLVENDRRELAHNLRMWLDYPKRRVRGIESVIGPSIERNFVAKAERFARGGRTWHVNVRNWGLGNVSFPARTLALARWDGG